jgi:predicted nucleic acid-binding Zn ribbon protein
VSRKRRRGEPERLGALMSGVLTDMGLGESARALRMAERWQEVAGAEIARHSRPTALRAGVLEVTVDSSVWCQQLQMRRPELLDALRRVLGEAAPRDLWLRLG